MGSKECDPEERPVHDVTVDSFWINRYTVLKERKDLK